LLFSKKYTNSFKCFSLSWVALFLSLPVTALARGSVAVCVAESKMPDRELHNLLVLTRVAGCLKYFYPDLHAASIDWHAFLVTAIPAVSRARSDRALGCVLDSLMAPIAGDARFVLKPPGAAGLEDGNVLGRIASGYYWEHRSLGRDKEGLGTIRLMLRMAGVNYRSQLQYADSIGVRTIYQKHEWAQVGLTDSLQLRFPLVMPEQAAKRRGKLPRACFTSANQHFQHHNLEHRLAVVMLSWNVLQQFYPYRDQLERVNWPKCLEQALQAAAAANSEQELLVVCRQMLAALQDQHVSFYRKSATGLHISTRQFDLTLGLVGSRLLVVRASERLQDRFPLGAELLAVDGSPLVDVLSRYQLQTPAVNNEQARRLAAAALLKRLATESRAATFTLMPPGGQRREVTIRFSQLKSRYRRVTALRTIAPGIVYLNASHLSYRDFLRQLPLLQAAQGLVVDFRQRPTYDMLAVMSHFKATAQQSDITATPVLTRPDFAGARYDSTQDITAARLPALLMPKVFLIGEHTYSYGETLVERVRHYQLGTLMGQTTGGTNGEMNFALISGRFQLSWTGRRVLNRDQQPYQGRGISPTIAVTPALEQILHGKDAEVEQAVHYLQSAH
jgi:C-terminal processing protease CtpA/Prc